MAKVSANDCLFCFVQGSYYNNGQRKTDIHADTFGDLYVHCYFSYSLNAVYVIVLTLDRGGFRGPPPAGFMAGPDFRGPRPGMHPHDPRRAGANPRDPRGGGGDPRDPRNRHRGEFTGGLHQAHRFRGAHPHSGGEFDRAHAGAAAEFDQAHHHGADEFGRGARFTGGLSSGGMQQESGGVRSSEFDPMSRASVADKLRQMEQQQGT